MLSYSNTTITNKPTILSKTMSTESRNIKIDRSNKKEVDKYIKEVFVHLKKAKTSIIFTAYKLWYDSRPEYASKDLTVVDFIPRTNKADFEKINKKKTIDVIYGDKYAVILAQFVRANRLYELELIKLTEKLVVAAKFEGENNLGTTKLLTIFEMNLIKDVFKLLRSEDGIVSVNSIPLKTPRKKKVILDSDDEDDIDVKSTLPMIDDNDDNSKYNDFNFDLAPTVSAAPKRNLRSFKTVNVDTNKFREKLQDKNVSGMGVLYRTLHEPKQSISNEKTCTVPVKSYHQMIKFTSDAKILIEKMAFELASGLKITE